jgi:hypothetical protein
VTPILQEKQGKKNIQILLVPVHWLETRLSGVSSPSVVVRRYHDGGGCGGGCGSVAVVIAGL